jgi:hypothetical protein
VEVPPRAKTTIAPGKAMVAIFFSGTKLPVFGVLLREEKFSQDHFLAMMAP